MKFQIFFIIKEIQRLCTFGCRNSYCSEFISYSPFLGALLQRTTETDEQDSGDLMEEDDANSKIAPIVSRKAALCTEEFSPFFFVLVLVL